MGKSAPKAPPPPDPAVVAAAQTQSNLDTARTNATLNRVDQYTPMGSLTYTNLGEQALDQRMAEMEAAYKAGTYVPAQQRDAFGNLLPSTWNPVLEREAARDAMGADYDRWQSNVTFSPEQQALYDLQTRAQNLYGTAAVSQLEKLQDMLGTPFNPNLPDVRSAQMNTSMPIEWGFIERRSGDLQYDVPSLADRFQTDVPSLSGDLRRTVGPDDFSADRRRVEEALFGRLSPQMDSQRLALENRLANQGLVAGTEAWRNAVDDFNRQENDARLAVTAAGGAEQQRMFGMDLAANQFANDATLAAYGMDLSSGNFRNDAIDRMFAQNLASGNFRNDAIDRMFAQNLASGGFRNQAVQTGFDMDYRAEDLWNRTRQGEIARMQAENAAIAQQQQADMALRQMMFGEQVAMRQMPLNEAAALLTGQQVQMPGFGAVPQVNVAGTDIMSAQNMAYQGQLAGYQGDVAAVNSANQGTAAAGAAAASLAAAAIIA